MDISFYCDYIIGLQYFGLFYDVIIAVDLRGFLYMIDKISSWFARYYIYYWYRFLRIDVSVIQMFEKFII